MLARFVVDSHARSQPKGANLEDRVPTDVDDDPLAAARQADPDVCIPAFQLKGFFRLFCG
jgi:DNA replication licensing factor MCM2